MSHEVLTRVDEGADFLRSNTEAAELAGQLPEQTAKQLRDIGVIRMLQPVDRGGYEADPTDFFEAVMAVARCCAAAGWVAGIVGVHPWELALMDERLQDEIWGSDPDTWIASPYAPKGIATRVDGGYLLSGRWPFSSGTDHCAWAVLGAMEADANGTVRSPPVPLHVMLPRADYHIDHDSWNVAGLSGTGSKDVIVDGAFIPDYRTLKASDLLDQSAAKRSPRWDTPLYRMPWSSIFPNAITAAVIGACEGVIDAHLDYQKDRVGLITGPVIEDAISLHAVGQASSDVAASRTQLLSNVRHVFEVVKRGGTVDLVDRAAFRRDQVRCSWRAVEAIDRLVSLSGGTAMRRDNPVQRFWRDAHMGLHHAINVSSGVYQFYATQRMGVTTASPIAHTI
jgi:3-hydroxy-9,10-secoandrosta-1,3,5(10)-triene-9,17-dione monooxygenase